jgi:transposase
MREIINGVFYVMRSGCPGRLLPSDLPPWCTIYRWFAKFRDEDRFAKINHALVMFDRERTGRQSSPTGAIIELRTFLYAASVMLLVRRIARTSRLSNLGSAGFKNWIELFARANSERLRCRQAQSRR